MGNPLALATQAFERDQQHHFAAYYWPVSTTAINLPGATPSGTDYTAFGSGVEFAMFDVLDSAFVFPTTATRAEIETALQRNSGKANAILGYNSNGTYRTGVVPNVYEYWGAGAPVGGSRARQVLLKYSGKVTRTVANATLVFCGQGSVYAVVTRVANGAQQQIVLGAVKEPVVQPDTVSVSASTIRNDFGYQFNESTITFNAGDTVEIYYLHNGEPWGGIAAKIIPGGATLTSASFLTQLREAPVVGTSFMAKETAAIAASPLRYIEDAAIKVGLGAVREMQVTVALSESGSPTGYSFQRISGEMLLVDNAEPTFRIRKGRTVHLEGGFRSPTNVLEVYPRFTGYIDDLFPAPDGTSCVIQCRGFEGKLTEVFDENLPDRVSYHASGYILREGSAEPVFGLPAFDQWPLETAINTLCYKAGIDAYSIGLNPHGAQTATTHGRWSFRLPDDSVFLGTRTVHARSLTNPDVPIHLERQSNYGNVPPVVRDYLAKDDPYLFPPQVTQRLYDRMQTLAEHYGYDCYFDGGGQLVLTGRNNPTYFQYFTKNGLYATNAATNQLVLTSAVGGIAFERLHTQGVWSKQITGKFARLDLYAGVGRTAAGAGRTAGLNGGLIQVVTEWWTGTAWAVLSTTQISTNADTPEACYYDDRLRRDGTNAALFTILQRPLDQYRVTLSGLGPESGGDCSYRLNGVAVYERDADQCSLVKAGVAQTLSTLGNILDLTPESNAKDMRNHVVVVGARKATITDSDKVANEANPNNQEFEFHVSVAVDPFSIYDPTSANFVGSKRMTVVYDEKINDSDMARWLTRTLLYRYRIPKTSARFRHTPLPTVGLRDALYVKEERNGTVDHLLWVTEYSEKWSNDDATIEVTALANPEIPSYQPREDIDIDTLFDHNGDGRGEPVIGVKIAYKNIFGQVVDNAALSNAIAIRGHSALGMLPNTVTDFINNGTTFQLSACAIPETVWLSWNYLPLTAIPVTEGQGFTYKRVRALTNNPYRHFFRVSSWDLTTRRPTLAFTFDEGDGTAGVYDKDYYEFPNSTNGQWYAFYEKLTTRTGINPYYDPYTSEVGNVVSIDAQLLVSGRVRVSIWDANRTSGQEVPVAWLTRPTEAGDDPDAHYVYMEAGAKSFVWDGVDNIGFWNTLQSIDFADEIKGAFGEKPNAVGRGFYAWNDKSTPLHTKIGDLNSANFGPDGAPMFTLGQYGQFYVKIEVMNDALMRKDVVRGIVEPRTVNSNALPNAPAWHTHAETYVWSHLPEPAQVAIRIQEWAGGGSWASNTPRSELNWTALGTAPDAQATLRDGRPVRMTFVPEPRKGILFLNAAGTAPDNTKTSAKLSRQVHLKATVFDQFWTFSGKPFSGANPKVTALTSENKRLTSRTFHNDDHTVEFEDSAWRTGADILSYEWVFDPTLFKKDFTGSGNERLRYGDYEQLESLPGFDVRRQGGATNSTRAYMTLAYINYLFYFSAFSMDRSGRRQWCLNSYTDAASGQRRGFIDKSKIVNPAWLNAADTNVGDKYKIVQHESHGAERYLKRSIFVRQWVEPTWASGTMATSPVALFGITDLAQLKYVQPLLRNFNLGAGFFSGNVTDSFLQEYSTTNSKVNREVLRRSTALRTGAGSTLSYSATLSGVTTDIALTQLGSWTFSNPTTAGWFTPSPCRDFHPYWRYPFMPDWGIQQTNRYLPVHAYNALNILESTSAQTNFKMRDPAAQENWFGYAFSAMGTEYLLDRAPRLEKSVEDAIQEDPSKVPIPLGVSGTAVNYMYDYVRQDQLDRWDQYRGVRSRAPYADREDSESASYRDTKRKKSASAQPVQASGTYLINLARYSDYTLAPVHVLENTNDFAFVHFTDKVTDWFDVRFSHEYVWYSDRFFPVSAEGGAMYAFTRTEYTHAFAYLGDPWWATLNGLRMFDANQISFDPGAWVGWKPDVAGWSGEPYLRWRELFATSVDRVGASVTLNTTRHATGGYGGAYAPTGLAELAESWINATVTASSTTYRRTNIFDDNLSATRRLRLAVGPESTTARPLVMNLTLPRRLLGL